MRTLDLFRLVLLAAIWGGSFIFMRILAPAIGPIWTADLRVLIASLLLLTYFFFRKFSVQWRRFWPHYLAIGVINTAIPFYLYAFAAQHIPASYSAVLNSTAPFFGAIIEFFWLGAPLRGRKILGIFLGASGVAIVMGLSLHSGPHQTISILACLLAAAFYGIGGVYTKKFGSEIPSKAIAGASQFMAGLALLPFAFIQPISLAPLLSPHLAISLGGIAFFCSAIAYLLYYRLIADLGAAKALTVTFLMPIFGLLWARLFLGEPLSISILLGGICILFGMYLVVKK